MAKTRRARKFTQAQALVARRTAKAVARSQKNQKAAR